jgi:hypothetical protein
VGDALIREEQAAATRASGSRRANQRRSTRGSF